MKPRKTAEQWEPPRGVRFFDLKDRPANPFALQWRVDGKAKTKCFADASDRLKFAKELSSDVQRYGLAALRLTPDEAREWRAFRADLGDEVELDDVLACWRRHGAIAGAVPLSKAIASFTEAKRAEGVSAAHLAHFKPVLDRLLASVGDVSTGSVKREEIEAFVASLKQANSSRRTNYARVKSLFHWLKATRQIADSPCEGLKSPKAVAAPISVLSVENAQKLFADNLAQPREFLGRLALESFSGMRHETAAKLPARAIDFRRRIITIPAAISKSRREEWIEGAPDCLFSWLAWSNPREWNMEFLQYRNAKCLAFVRADVPHPHNVLRHSFATYHIAAHGDAGRTAAILTHSSLKMLWRHYRGKGGGEDYARGWFEIYPPSGPGDWPATLIEQIAG